MVKHFSELRAHIHHVRSWYRYTLRNINHGPIFSQAKKEIRDVVRSTIHKHRGSKSSWKVYSLLQDIRILNEHIRQLNLPGISLLLHKHRAVKEKKNIELLDVSREVIFQSNTNKNRDPLRSFLYSERKKMALPNDIPEEYIEKLIEPLVKHQRGINAFHKVQLSLSKGPPKTYLSYTMTGPGKLWFVRSAVNRRKKQSKALGTYIRFCRFTAQKNLDALRKLEKDLQWALQEYAWEDYLKTGNLVHKNQDLIISYIMDRKSSKTTGSNQMESLSPEMVSWLEPIKHSINYLHTKKIKLIKILKLNKDKLLFGGQFGYYDMQSQAAYQRRLRRYKNMLGEMRSVNPYSESHNIWSLLKKWNMIDTGKR
ncbi:Rrg1p Ecym_2348 [Eremothecium cymbalariae DBVPG|uniref:Required for respiratory growth protein 1, mitochondrial n=1 Tax=Eremothecium cymbalariae (strain CBS 270.75 / DBVPG 7215 / KCTC 17166 / NRRL Y-17582) TaxID=931890 RepID=G8JNL4_ERECY|nr:Hypothetical protein Ecym_2348 [Eremothecium cymbalariae DBVPG\